MAAATLQTNEGHTYITDVTVAAGLSPSRHSQVDVARAQQKAKKMSRKGKVRRKILREQRGKSQQVSEL